MNHIEVENANTWPIQARKLLENNLNILSLHAEREIAYPDLPLLERINAVNPYKAQQRSIIEQLDQIINNHHLIGYHCTRLLDSEITNIQINGLNPLSPELFANRIKQATEGNIITPDTASHLLSNNLCSETNRKGRLWFVCGISELKMNMGLVSFLKHGVAKQFITVMRTMEFLGQPLNLLANPA